MIVISDPLEHARKQFELFAATVRLGSLLCDFGRPEDEARILDLAAECRRINSELEAMRFIGSGRYRA